MGTLNLHYEAAPAPLLDLLRRLMQEEKGKRGQKRGQSRNLVINHKYVVNKGRSGIVVIRLNRSKVGDEKKNTRLRD